MVASLPARLALIAVLVLFQAVYAGHSVQHDSGVQPECNICLQTSAGAAVLPGRAIAVALPPPALDRPAALVAPAAPACPTLFPPSRAPPALPV